MTDTGRAQAPKTEQKSAQTGQLAQQLSQNQFAPVFVDNRAEALAQRKRQENADNSPQTLQLRATQAMMAAAAQRQANGKPKTNNTGLPDTLKCGIENVSGMTMDDVKVHYNSSKPAQLQALAYAQGTDIHVAPGQEKHLPHEAWHVVQQKQGRVQPTLQAKGVGVNDDIGLEREADVMGAKALAQGATAGAASSAPNAAGRNTTQATQRLAVIQRFHDTGAATAWLALQMPVYSANAVRLVRMQPYVTEFRDMVQQWIVYDFEANQLATIDLQAKLGRMNAMAAALEPMEAAGRAQIPIETAKNAAPGRVEAIAFTQADSWYRPYADAGQRTRMTEISALYATQTAVRANYVAALLAICDGLRDVDMTTLEAMSVADKRAAVLAAVAQAKVTHPVADLTAIRQELTAIQALVEAAALLGVNAKFANLNVIIGEFDAAHTEGSGLNARGDALRAFYAAHDNAVVDKRNIDARLVEAQAVRNDARAFVNAQFADIVASIDPVRDIVGHAMAGIQDQAHHGVTLAALDVFVAAHDNAVLDARDHRPFVAQAEQLNTDVTAWADVEFIAAGGAGAPIVAVPAFEAAAAPYVGRRAQFRSLIRQGTITPGPVLRRFYSGQDVTGGYTYAFAINGAVGTAIHAHYLADDSLGGAHFKPRGMPGEGELGHGVNQLTAAQMANFVTASRGVYDAANGPPPANVRKP